MLLVWSDNNLSQARDETEQLLTLDWMSMSPVSCINTRLTNDCRHQYDKHSTQPNCVSWDALVLLSGYKWHGLAISQPSISVIALKRTQNTDPNDGQSPNGVIIHSYMISLYITSHTPVPIYPRELIEDWGLIDWLRIDQSSILNQSSINQSINQPINHLVWGPVLRQSSAHHICSAEVVPTATASRSHHEAVECRRQSNWSSSATFSQHHQQDSTHQPTTGTGDHHCHSQQATNGQVANNQQHGCLDKQTQILNSAF